jgi:hypothetical protein
MKIGGIFLAILGWSVHGRNESFPEKPASMPE